MGCEASSGIAIDADFPGGNILVESISEDEVHLRPDQRDSDRWWFYWYFRVRGATGRDLAFHFEGDDPIGERGPAVSRDCGRNWSWLGTDVLLGDGSFVYSFRGSPGEVRFCFAHPYLEDNLHCFLGPHRDDPALSVCELSRSRKGRSVERLHLGRLDGKPRVRMLVTARHHACEMMASYVLEGLMETVLSDTDDGRWYRREVEVMVVPFVDKDGVQDGDQGKARMPHDHNRDYTGKGLYPSVRAIRRLVPEWSHGVLRVALDLHCPWIRGHRNDSIYIVGSPEESIWREQCRLGSILEEVQVGPLEYRATDNLPYGVDWNRRTEPPVGKSSLAWATELGGIWMTAGFEIPYATARGAEVNPSSARAFGRDLARALRVYLTDMIEG